MLFETIINVNFYLYYQKYTFIFVYMNEPHHISYIIVDSIFYLYHFITLSNG